MCLKGFQILNLRGLNFGTSKFVVLIATSNPLKNVLNYGGNYLSVEKALQTGCTVIKVRCELIVILWVWELHDVSIWSVL